MWESLEFPRDLWNGFEQNADGDKDNEVQTEVVSEKLIGNWRKGHFCYTLAKRLMAFYPCPRYLWSIDLERDDLVYLAGKISKQQSIQEVTWLILQAFSYMYSQIDGLK